MGERYVKYHAKYIKRRLRIDSQDMAREMAEVCTLLRKLPCVLWVNANSLFTWEWEVGDYALPQLSRLLTSPTAAMCADEDLTGFYWPEHSGHYAYCFYLDGSLIASGIASCADIAVLFNKAIANCK